MTRTHVHDRHAELGPDAPSVTPATAAAGTSRSLWDVVGDSGVYTSVLDLARWDANFYTPKVGGKALVSNLLHRARLRSGAELAFASGFIHGSFRGLSTVSHPGATLGYRAQLLRFPDQRTSVIVLCNAAHANAVAHAQAVAGVVLANDLGAEPPQSAPIALSREQFDAWSGSYRTAWGHAVEVQREDDHLVDSNGQVLEPLDEQTFAVRGGVPPTTVRFEGVRPRRRLIRGSEPFLL